MSKIAITCLPLAALFSLLWQTPAHAVEEDVVSFQVRFSDSYSSLSSNRDNSAMGGRRLGGPSNRILEKLMAALVDGDALTKATADVLGEPKASVIYVPFDEWRIKTPDRQEGKTFVTVATMSQTSGGGWSELGLTIRFDHRLDASKAKSIVPRYVELIAPNVKKLSERLFTENFEPAMEEAKKTLEAADAKVNQFDGERRNLQLRSYEELPYEKVADHLADLQRQQLSLKLSIVGMDAKKNELEKQIDRAQVKLKERELDAQQDSGAKEIIDTLNEIVSLKQKKLASLAEIAKKAPGTVAQSDIDDANAILLETKLRLLSAQSRKPVPASTEQLDALQSELTRLAIDRSEQQARLEYLEKMRAEVQDRIANRASLDRDIKRIDEQLPAATTALRRAEARVRELENTKASFKPIDLTKSDS
jgi:hypothetical protein